MSNLNDKELNQIIKMSRISHAQVTFSLPEVAAIYLNLRDNWLQREHLYKEMTEALVKMRKYLGIEEL